MAIDYLDGFEHQNETASGVFSGVPGLWSSIGGSTLITYQAGRTGNSIKFAQNAVTAANAITDTLPASQARCGSFYIRIPSAPTVTSDIFQVQTTGGGTRPLGMAIIATTGLLRVRTNDAGTQNGPNVCDNAWHRIDWYVATSTTTWTTQWKVDGVAQTNSSQAGTASTDSRRLLFGSTSTAHTCTVEFDDFVTASDGTTDYPINTGTEYSIGVMAPTGDGTHNAGTNIIEDQAGTDIVSPNAFGLINDAPPNETDYIRQITTGSTNYAEVTFADTAETSILAASCAFFGGAAQAASPNGTIRIVDSGGSTLVDLFSGDMGGGSSNTRGGNLRIPAVAGGNAWTQSDLNGIKLRFGFSTSASGSSTPRLVDALVQYVSTPAVGGGAAVLDPMGMRGFFGG